MLSRLDRISGLLRQGLIQAAPLTGVVNLVMKVAIVVKLRRTLADSNHQLSHAHQTLTPEMLRQVGEAVRELQKETILVTIRRLRRGMMNVGRLVCLLLKIPVPGREIGATVRLRHTEKRSLPCIRVVRIREASQTERHPCYHHPNLKLDMGGQIVRVSLLAPDHFLCMVHHPTPAANQGLPVV